MNLPGQGLGSILGHAANVHQTLTGVTRLEQAIRVLRSADVPRVWEWMMSMHVRALCAEREREEEWRVRRPTEWMGVRMEGAPANRIEVMPANRMEGAPANRMEGAPANREAEDLDVPCNARR